MLNGAKIKSMDGVPAMIWMVLIEQCVQANYLKSHILNVHTDKEVGLVINHTNQDKALIRAMKTGQDTVITNAMKTGTLIQILSSDITN